MRDRHFLKFICCTGFKFGFIDLVRGKEDIRLNSPRLYPKKWSIHKVEKLFVDNIVISRLSRKGITYADK